MKGTGKSFYAKFSAEINGEQVLESLKAMKDFELHKYQDLVVGVIYKVRKYRFETLNIHRKGCENYSLFAKVVKLTNSQLIHKKEVFLVDSNATRL